MQDVGQLDEWLTGFITVHPRCFCSGLGLQDQIPPRTTTFLQLVKEF